MLGWSFTETESVLSTSKSEVRGRSSPPGTVIMGSGVRLAVGSLGDAVGIPSAAQHAAAIVLSSAVAFQCLNVAFNFTPAPGKVDRERRFRWRNINTSFVHSIISGFWSTYCLYISPEILEDIKLNYTMMSEVLVAISVGYFAYDLIDMLINRPIRNTWPLVTHHVVILICFGISLWLHTFIGYAVVALTAELNSISLHLRQLLLMTGIAKTSALFRANGLANMATFLLFRFGTLAWMLVWLLAHRPQVPALLAALAGTGLLVMTVINAILFKRLLVSDFLTPADKLGKERNVLEK